MADRYIDSSEVREYGDHFISEAKKLIGASKLVDVEALIQRVAGDMASVGVELGKTGMTRSEARGAKTDTSDVTAKARRTVEQFWSYLGTLDDDVAVDVQAFFAGGKLGALASLKPADVQSKMGAVLKGFAAKGNAKLPDAAAWKAKLTAAEAALGATLAGKGSVKAGAVKDTAALTAARARFLVSYNGVAKKLVLGLLTALDRADELVLFFKDLQVQEGGADKAKEPAPQPGAPVAPK